MAWIVLSLAIAVEVTGTTLMKLSKGFTVLWPTVGVFICYALSLSGLIYVLRYIDLSITYAIWSGAGTALVAVIGIMWFKEPAGALKITSLVLVIAGVIGLQMSSGPSG